MENRRSYIDCYWRYVFLNMTDAMFKEKNPASSSTFINNLLKRFIRNCIVIIYCLYFF